MCSDCRVTPLADRCCHNHYSIGTRIISTLIHTIQTSNFTIRINALVFHTVVLAEIFWTFVTVLYIIIKIKLIGNIFAICNIIHLSHRVNNSTIIYSTCNSQRCIMICDFIIHKTYLQILSISCPTHKRKQDYQKEPIC